MRRRPSVSRAARRRTGRAARARFGLRGARLLILAAAVLIGAAVLAPIGHATEGGEKDAAKNARLAERAARHNARLAEKEVISKQREAERAAKREAHRLAHEAEQAVHLEKEGNVVKIECHSVTITYNGFPDLPRNSSTVYLSLHTEPHEPPVGPIPFSFDGATGTQTIPVVFPIGRSLVDVRAKWDSNGHKGGFDIHGPAKECPPAPAFTVEKLQTIEGGTLTTKQITGEVGQTVFYEIIATNIGNTLLTFGELVDEHCDEGTVSTTSTGATEPGQQVTFFCTHKLTQKDEEASPLINVAKVTGTPEPGEGTKGTVGSNPVEAIVNPHKTEEKEPVKEKEPEKTGGNEKTNTTPKQEVLGNTTTSPPASTGKSGVLGFASATVPALHGPQGCVRSAFTASVRSAGVQSVTFYLDGHKLKTLTYRSAHKGLLSIKVDGSKLKVGVHRLMAKVTMKQSSPTAKAAKATRSLMFVRCKSATVTPRFTG
jgi:hypothetical protein